jgi:hypothetical protein
LFIALNQHNFDLGKTDSLKLAFSSSSQLVLDFSQGKNSSFILSLLLGGKANDQILPAAPIRVPIRQITRPGRAEIIIFDFECFKIFDAVYLIGIISIIWHSSAKTRFNSGNVKKKYASNNNKLSFRTANMDKMGTPA